MALATNAAASDRPTAVGLALPGCPALPFERASFLELLAIELRADGVEQVKEEGASTIALLRVEQPDCAQPRLQLVLEDRTTGKTVGRAVDLGSIEGNARARFLALSGAELLRASWMELVALRPAAEDPLTRAVRARLQAMLPPLPAPPAPAPAPTPAPLPERAPPEQPAPSRQGAWWFGVSSRSYPATQGAMLGGSLGGQVPWREALRWRFEARGLAGEAFDPLGTVRLRQLSGLAALQVELGTSTLRLGVGPQIEVGLAQLRGEPAAPGARGTSETRPVATLGAATTLAGQLTRRLAAQSHLELGHTLAGLTAAADGRRVAGLRGVFLGLGVGMTWSP
jgi:hypothetical protein